MASQEIDTSSSLLLQACNLTNVGIIILDSDQRIVFWNDWTGYHSGLKLEDVRGSVLNKVFPKLDNPRLDNSISDCINSKMFSILSPRLHPYVFPLSVPQPKAGGNKPVGQMVSISPLKLEAGELYCLIQIVDVTTALAREKKLREQSKNLSLEVDSRTKDLLREIKQHKDTEMLLRDSEEHFRSLYENAPNAYCTVSIEDGSIKRFNRQMINISGYSADELNEFKISELFTDDEGGADPGLQIFKKLKKGESTTNAEAQLTRGDDKSIWASVSVEPALGSNGRVTGGRYSIIDISDSRINHYRMLQVSKLASLGEMATGIAHELNQPLNIIRMSADSLVEALEEGETLSKGTLEKKLERITSQTGRAAEIIDHIRVFGRKADDQATGIFMNDIVQRVCTFMTDQLRLDGIDLINDTPETCRIINSSQIKMEQVIVNLVSNARDSINSCKNNNPDSVDDGKIFICINDDISLDYVKIVIRDNGGGVSNDIINKIFDPFFTTKKMKEGTGLGLSLSYGIISEAGGEIIVENIEDGAQFTIILPVAPKD